jgi:hypothetical protein
MKLNKDKYSKNKNTCNFIDNDKLTCVKCEIEERYKTAKLVFLQEEILKETPDFEVYHEFCRVIIFYF